jgi:hypothetical protein
MTPEMKLHIFLGIKPPNMKKTHSHYIELKKLNKKFQKLTFCNLNT